MAVEERRAAIEMLRRAADNREAQTSHDETMRKLTASPLLHNTETPGLRRSRTLPSLSTLANHRAATPKTQPPEDDGQQSNERLQVRQNLMRKLSQRQLRRRSKSVGAMDMLSASTPAQMFSADVPQAVTEEPSTNNNTNGAHRGYHIQNSSPSATSFLNVPFSHNRTNSRNTSSSRSSLSSPTSSRSPSRNHDSPEPGLSSENFRFASHSATNGNSIRLGTPVEILGDASQHNNTHLYPNTHAGISHSDILEQAALNDSFNSSIQATSVEGSTLKDSASSVHSSMPRVEMAPASNYPDITSSSEKPDPEYRFPAPPSSNTQRNAAQSVSPPPAPENCASPKLESTQQTDEAGTVSKHPPSTRSHDRPVTDVSPPSTRRTPLPRVRIQNKINSIIKLNPSQNVHAASPIDNPPRRFLDHGPILQVLGQSAVKKRHLFLFSDCLLVAKPCNPASEPSPPHSSSSEDSSPESLQSLFIPKMLIPLDGLTMMEPGKGFSKGFTDTSQIDESKATFAKNFATDPQRAIESLFIESSPSVVKIGHIARLLISTDSLDPFHLARYLLSPENDTVLKEFIDQLHLPMFDVDNALRVLFAFIKPSRHLPTVERLLNVFSERYAKGFAGSEKRITEEIVRKLVFSTMELDDALHSGLSTPYTGDDGATNKQPRPEVTKGDTERELATGMFSFPNPAISQADFVDAFRLKDPNYSIEDGKVGSMYRSVKRVQLVQPPAPTSHEAPALFNGTAVRPTELSFGSEPLPERLIYRRPSSRITLSTRSPIQNLRVKVIAPPHVRVSIEGKEFPTSPPSSGTSLSTPTNGSKLASEVYLSFASTTTYSFEVIPTKLEGPHAIYFVLLGSSSAKTRFAPSHAVSRPCVWRFNVQRDFMANTFVLSFPRPLSSVNGGNQLKRFYPKYRFSMSENYEAHLKWVTLIKQRIEAARARLKPRLKAQRAAEQVAWMVLNDDLCGKKKTKGETDEQLNSLENSTSNPASTSQNSLLQSQDDSRTRVNTEETVGDSLGSVNDVKTGKDLIILIQQNSLLPAVLGLLNAGAEVAPHPLDNPDATAFRSQISGLRAHKHAASDSRSTGASQDDSSTAEGAFDDDRSGWL